MKLTCMTESWCAKKALWQSPKSRPQIRTFLSAEHVAISLLSEEMLRLRTGSLWPYSVRKSLSESTKKILTVLSRVATASHDKSIRVWEVGDDLIFLEEEREKEQEELYEATLAQNLDRDFQEEDQQQDEVAAASKQTIATLTHGEKVMEALEAAITDLELMRAYERDKARNPKIAVPQRNPLFLALGNITAEQHVLTTLRKIPTPALHDALLVIPFSTLPTLFVFLSIFLKRRMMPELAWRVTYFLLQAHMNQTIASGQLRPVLEDISRAYEEWQEEVGDVMAVNLAGLDVMCRDVREAESGGYLNDVVEEEMEEAGKGRKKRAFGSIA